MEGRIFKDEGASTQSKEQPEYDFSIEGRPMSAIEQQYEKLPDSVPRRIHILGTGSVGKLIAHSLRLLPDPPPVTLLFHRQLHYDEWIASPRTITINRNGDDIVADGFDAELVPKLARDHGVALNPEVALPQSMRNDDLSALDSVENEDISSDDSLYNPSVLLENQNKSSTADALRDRIYNARDVRSAVSHGPIDNLIVTTKAQMTLKAIEPIKHRLTPEASICFLQNGMGMVEELNAKLFTNPETRPVYVQGVISHGVNVPPMMRERNKFYAVHAGQGTIAVGIRPPSERPTRTPQTLTKLDDDVDLGNYSSRYVMRTLTRSIVLVAVAHAPIELLKLQLEKLAINAIINPLTALLDVENGRLFETQFFKRTMRLMLAEISMVIRSLPELRGLANVNTRFSSGQLESLVEHVARITGPNISSMLADVRMGRYPTEIDYINGYLIRMGELAGIRCVVNYSIMNLVKAKVRMNVIAAEAAKRNV